MRKAFYTFFLFCSLITTAPKLNAQTPTLWGLASGGGQYNLGCIFSYDINAHSEVIQYSFDSASGVNPNGSLIQASNGYLYGMTAGGGTFAGAFSGGTIFSFNTSTGAYSVLHNFGSDSDGKAPWGSLFQADNGLLYGMARYGGLNNAGMIFSYNIISGTYMVVHDFHLTVPPSDGIGPFGSIMQASNGILYGMTYYGGANRDGAIFRYDPVTDEYRTAYSFKGPEGRSPFGSLTQASDSLLLGMTSMGGNNYNGSIFSYNIYTDSVALIRDFGLFNQGLNPRGSFIKANNGLLYGLMQAGGPDTVGFIFSYNIQNGKDSDVYDFKTSNDGNDPYGSLMQASNGLLYGTTLWGGIQDSGTLFSYDIANGTEVVLHNFTSVNDGSLPTCDLLEVDFSTSVYQLAGGESNLQIWPNPASDKLTGIISSTSQKATGQIIVPDGRVLMSNISIQQEKFEIDASSLPAGLYFLEVQTENQRWVKKFVKE